MRQCKYLEQQVSHLSTRTQSKSTIGYWMYVISLVCPSLDFQQEQEQNAYTHIFYQLIQSAGNLLHLACEQVPLESV